MANPFTGFGGALARGFRRFGEANYATAMREKYGPDWEHQQAVRDEEMRRRRSAEDRSVAQEERASRQADIAQTGTLAQLVAHAMEGQQAPTNYEGVMPPDFDLSAPGLEPPPPAPAPVDVRGLVSGFGLKPGQADLAVAAGSGLARQSKRQMAILAAERQAAAAGQRESGAMDRLLTTQDRIDARHAQDLGQRAESQRERLGLAWANLAQRDEHFGITYERLRAQGIDDRSARAAAQRTSAGNQIRLAIQRNTKLSPEQKQQEINEANAIYGSPRDINLPGSSVAPLPQAPRAAPAPVAAPPARERTATGPNGQKLVLRNGQWVPLR